MSFSTSLPRHKPRSLHDYLVAAARAQFPPNNDHRLARLFELLSRRRTVNEGWVSRAEIAALWPGGSQTDLESRKRHSGGLTNAIVDLREQIARRLEWTLPHFTIKVEADPPHRAERYRLSVRRREAPWDFQRDEAPNTLPLNLSYRFGKGTRHVVQVRTWATTVGPHRALEIEAVREPPRAEWQPAPYGPAYRRIRDEFFEAENARLRTLGLRELHASTVWGIKDVQVTEGHHGSAVRIVTEKTSYKDLHFLKRNLDQPFTALRKHGTFRDWLQMEADPRGGFCPPRDALCVDALVMARTPEPTVFVARQKSRNGAGRWEASAVGAASDAHQNVSDERPDLRNQVSGVVHREIGLKIDLDRIRWLGVARGLRSTSSTTVLAFIETDSTPNQILEKFAHRRDRDDVEALTAVRLDRMHDWLKRIPHAERGEFLELTLALAAIDRGVAVID